MTNADEEFAQANAALFNKKAEVLVKRGGASATKTTFVSTDFDAFQKALEEKPGMTWLEYIATKLKKAPPKK